MDWKEERLWGLPLWIVSNKPFVMVHRSSFEHEGIRFATNENEIKNTVFIFIEKKAAFLVNAFLVFLILSF
jgi:hypothetical protein